MKNHSLVILLWIACQSLAFAYTNTTDTNRPEMIATLSIKQCEPTEKIRFFIDVDNQPVRITNAEPIKELRVYDNKGKLIDTRRYLSGAYRYDTSALVSGKYAFNINVADKVITRLYKK